MAATTDPYAGLNPDFAARLKALIDASGGRLSIRSGFRSHDEQQALWDASDHSGKMVAAPGHSNHERGLAADLQGDLKWALANAARFGLHAPMQSYEPWHFEPIVLPGAAGGHDPLAYTSAANGQPPVQPADKVGQVLSDFYHALGGQGMDQSTASTDTASSSPTTSTGAASGDVVSVITQIANELGIDPRLALAIAKQESDLNPREVGDNDSSFGLFQLHRGGELGSMTPDQAYDPATNARTALSVVASVARQHPDWSPGQIAAAAQRPADPAGYAESVNSIYNSGAF